MKVLFVLMAGAVSLARGDGALVMNDPHDVLHGSDPAGPAPGHRR